jgi:hypothetical protein
MFRLAEDFRMAKAKNHAILCRLYRGLALDPRPQAITSEDSYGHRYDQF